MAVPAFDPRCFALLTAGYRTFLFPPLRDHVLLTLGSVLAQAAHLDVLLLVPAWTRRPAIQLLLRHAHRIRRLRFVAHHGSVQARRLQRPWEWLLLTFRRGPPGRLPAPPHLGLLKRISNG